MSTSIAQQHCLLSLGCLRVRLVLQRIVLSSGPSGSLAVSLSAVCWRALPDTPHSRLRKPRRPHCYRYLGVDQVLLYDNNEDGGAQAAELADFIQDGFLTYYTVPGQAMQVPVYHLSLIHI